MGRRGFTRDVLLHGLRAYGHWFDDFSEIAKSSFRIIAPDQRGRGESDWAPDRDYATDAYVADLEGVANTLIEGKFVLASHSMGGGNAVSYAASHPNRISALLLLDYAPESNPVGLQRIKSEVPETPKDFGTWNEARSLLRHLPPIQRQTLVAQGLAH